MLPYLPLGWSLAIEIATLGVCLFIERLEYPGSRESMLW